MNYIKINAVLNRIPEIIKQESDKSTLLSFILDGLRLLNISQYHIETAEVLEISNFKAQLPNSIKTIKKVYYMKNKPSQTALESVSCDICEANLSELQEQTNPKCEHSINYQLFLDSYFFKNCFHKMSYKGNRNSLCKNCLDYNNQYEYTVNPLTNELTTSVNKGYLCVVYLSELKDEEGDFLIPDTQKVINFLRTWAMYRHWENRGYSKEQNAYRIAEDLLRKSEILLRSAKGSILQRNIDINAINRSTGINTTKNLIKAVYSYGEHTRY